MKTGYFARATEKGHSAKFTKVHIIDNNGKPICRYKPHETMQFMFCSQGITLRYVECPKCKEKGEELIILFAEKKIGKKINLKIDKDRLTKTILSLQVYGHLSEVGASNLADSIVDRYNTITLPKDI